MAVLDFDDTLVHKRSVQDVLRSRHSVQTDVDERAAQFLETLLLHQVKVLVLTNAGSSWLELCLRQHPRLAELMQQCHVVSARDRHAPEWDPEVEEDYSFQELVRWKFETLCTELDPELRETSHVLGVGDSLVDLEAFRQWYERPEAAGLTLKRCVKLQSAPSKKQLKRQLAQMHRNLLALQFQPGPEHVTLELEFQTRHDAQGQRKTVEAWDPTRPPWPRPPRCSCPPSFPCGRSQWSCRSCCSPPPSSLPPTTPTTRALLSSTT